VASDRPGGRHRGGAAGVHRRSISPATPTTRCRRRSPSPALATGLHAVAAAARASDAAAPAPAPPVAAPARPPSSEQAPPAAASRGPGTGRVGGSSAAAPPRLPPTGPPAPPFAPPDAGEVTEELARSAIAGTRCARRARSAPARRRPAHQSQPRLPEGDGGPARGVGFQFPAHVEKAQTPERWRRSRRRSRKCIGGEVHAHARALAGARQRRHCRPVAGRPAVPAPGRRRR
jgi:hypothetical protein